MSVATINTEIVEKFQIEANPLYEPLNNESITLLSNMPNNVKYTSIHNTGSSASNMTFQTQLTDKTFLKNSFFLQKTIPVVIELATAYSENITAANYADALQDLVCFKQFPLTGVIQSLSLKLNNNVVSNISNVGNAYKIISNYYNDSAVNEFMLASDYDRFKSVEDFNGSKSIDSLDLNGNKIKYYIPAVNDANPFKSAFKKDFNSRVPVFTFDTATTIAPSTTRIPLLVTIGTHLPFSVFGLSDTDTSLYALNNLEINIDLVDNFVPRMFMSSYAAATQTTAAGFTIASIAYNVATTSQDTSILNLVEILPPEYIRKKMAWNGKLLPYRFGTTTYSAHQDRTVTFKLSETSATLESSQINFTSVPRNMYIAFKRRVPNGTLAFKYSDHYCRIKSLSVTLGTNTTNINIGALNMFNLAKGNGLNADYESSMFCRGFPVKLSLEKDLGFGSDQLIGTVERSYLTVKADLENLCHNEADVVYDMIVILTYDSQVVFNDGQFTLKEGLVIPSHELSTSIHAERLYDKNSYLTRQVMLGGAWYTKAFKFGKQIANTAYKLYKENPELINSIVKNVGAGSNIIGGSSTKTLGAGSVRSISFKSK